MSMPMSPEAEAPTPQTHQTQEQRTGLRPVLLDVAIVTVWFVVAGALGAFVWSLVTELPKVTREGNSGTVAPEQLGMQVGIDGWFFVIALIGGAASGLILLAWRNRDPVLTVVLVVLGAGMSSWLMVVLGRALGPEKELVTLRSATEGGQVSMQLQLSAPGMAWVWPVSVALGALVQLWVLEKESNV